MKLRNKIDTVALFLLCIGMLFYVNNRILPKSLYFFAFSSFLMIFNLFTNVNYRINKKCLGFLFFFIYLLMCLFISYSGDSFGYIIYYFFGIIYMFYFSKNIESITKIVKFYYIGTIIFTLFTLLSFLFGSVYLKVINFLYGGTPVYSIIVDLFSWNEHSGIAGQTGYNAFTISIGIIISFVKIIEYFKFNGKINKKFLIIFLLQIISLFLCSKRAILLYSLTTIVFLVPICVNLKKKKNLSRLLFVCIIILFVGSFSINYFEPFGNVFAKNSYYLSKGDIFNGRLPLYTQAIQLFKENPLFGIGIKRFYLLNELNLDVHNVYLQLLAENGIIGFSIIIFSFIYMFFKTKGAINKSDNNSLIYISLGIQLFFLLYALSGNTFYDVNMLYLYLILGSISINLRGDENEEM